MKGVKIMDLVNCKDCKTKCQLQGRDCDVKCNGFVRKGTYFEKIRAMTVEELARYLWIESGRMTVEEWLDWLRSEVSDG